MAVVKPAGLATAHAPRDEPSVYALARRTRPFVGIVSRLDLPVSGIVVLAKTRQAAADLAGQFRDRTVAKEYIAVVEGRFPAAVGGVVMQPKGDGSQRSDVPQLVVAACYFKDQLNQPG